MSLRIFSLFGAASLQGPRHPGHRGHGAPPGGAFDQRSFLVANALVGNCGGEVCLELGMGRGSFEVDVPLTFAVIGCEATLDGEALQSGISIDAEPGQRLEVGLPHAARSYLAVAGGWSKLGSNELTGGGRTADSMKRNVRLPVGFEGPFRAVPIGGDEASVEALTGVVSHQLDRVGIRLETGVKFSRPGIRSEPVTMGTIQVPPSGSPIILGPDGPTVGGYAKLGAVCRADWDRLGQLKPGDKVSFPKVSVDEARELWHEYEAETERVLNEINGG